MHAHMGSGSGPAREGGGRSLGPPWGSPRLSEPTLLHGIVPFARSKVRVVRAHLHACRSGGEHDRACIESRQILP